MTISVVSGTYNRLTLLQRMVKSARESAGDLPLEIVLVDGGSTDGTIEWCKSQRDIKLVEHGELLGAIRAYNDGFAAASSTYIVIGNDDIIFDGDTIARAYHYMLEHPRVGQIAFRHHYQRRGQPQHGRIQGAYGYPYGQCSMLPKWLGDFAGWWGDAGMKTYGGDTHLSLRLWEMGWGVAGLQGCSVTDYEHDDGLRAINSDSPRMGGRTHPDLVAFSKTWTDRLPPRSHWISAPVNVVMHKAARGNLRTLRFKGMMAADHEMRHALIDEMSRYGTGQQINQMAEARKHGMKKYQDRVKAIVKNFRPDLIIFQAQRQNNVLPETVLWLRQKYPDTFLCNFDGDCHFPLTSFQFEIAAAMHLQLVVSPTLFQHYAAQGIGVGYWPIGIERDYDVPRAKVLDGPDVLFLGALYGEGVFPEAVTRREAVKALHKSDLNFALYGNGWNTVGIRCGRTNEEHDANAKLMARTKMTLSISQASAFWGYTSDRLYNICSTGCPALVQRFAGMEQHGYVDGETCIGWKTIPEMLKKARYYLEHDEERERIGAAGKKMTLERHTWKRRVEGLFAMIEGL
jgi:glycosyltransferase involved in cell wall biosynthesis